MKRIKSPTTELNAGDRVIVALADDDLYDVVVESVSHGRVYVRTEHGKLMKCHPGAGVRFCRVATAEAA